MTAALNALDVPLSELELQVSGWVAEALQIRFEGTPSLPVDATVASEIMQVLLDVRQRLDRLEGLLGVARRAKGRAHRASRTGRWEADTSWDQAVVAIPRREYEGPRERYAEASLASLVQQRTARAGENLSSVADEAYDVIKMAHDGMSSLRYDLVAMLRGFGFESSLER